MHEVNGNDSTGKMHIRSKKKRQQQCHEVHEFIARISQFSVKFIAG